MAGPNKPLTNVVYRSLGQVWEALGLYSSSPEIKHLTALCINRGLLDKSAGESIATSFRDRSCPFIVIEGMDGTGKTTLTKCLANKLNMTQISTPPKLPEFQQARPFFDNQPESLRRAYYSLGNYLAAQDVVDCKGPVVMDRFWHSTAAYAMAHQIKTSENQPKTEDFIWPDDLLKPDLVIFLQVSEQERIRRHTNRKDFTNTAEEQTLADNESFRHSLSEIYRKISGPKFLELNVDGEQPLVEDKILKTVLEHFPMLENPEKQTGEICLAATTVQEVLSAADMIGLSEVVESCTDYLKNELHPTNSIGIFRFAESLQLAALSNFALSYIYRHFPEVCEQEEFFEAPKNVVLQFIESEELTIDSEFQILSAAVKWLIHHLQDRKHHVFEILSKVRLPLIPSTLLQTFTEKQTDPSLQCALRCLQKDLSGKRGYLVTLTAQPRRNAKKHVYVIGGSQRALGSGWKQLSETTLDSVVCLDTFQKSWTAMSPMGIERILPGVSALEGLIYVVGGEQESKILANGEVYNPQEDSWTPIEPMVVPRCAFGLSGFENHLYAFGGWVGEDIGGSIERYDPQSNEWKLIGNMEEPKFSMGICTHEGLIYVVGGCTHQTRHLKELLSYNPVTSEWETLKPMKVPRSQMGLTVLDGHLYAIGGSSKHAEVLRSVEKYIFEEDKWVEVASLKFPRANPAVGSVDGKIYVIGGDYSMDHNFFRAQVTLASVEVYDPLSDTWEECSNLNLPESRSEAGYVVI